jgi:Tol biopolymer transport system component
VIDQQSVERAAERFRVPQGSFERLALRRDRKRRNQRIRAGALGVAIAVAVGWLGINAIRSAQLPADDPAPAPGLPELRRDGEVIVFEPRATGEDWDLAAQDPETGEVRTIVETGGITDCPDPERCRSFVKAAEWSPDGRWAAFTISYVNLDGEPIGPCGSMTGVWVLTALDDPRQVTTPCDSPPSPGSDRQVEELWSWSPDGTRIAYARVDGATDELFLIDPSDGRRTSLGTADRDVSLLEWSPDGTRIAYADGDAVYAVEVDEGGRSLLSDSFVDIIDIAWSPDGTQILVHDQTRYRLQVMNADGSELHPVLEGEDACCGPAWSPDGTRIAYLISRRWGSMFEYDTEIWTIAPDGSNRIKIFDSNRCDTLDAEPVWAPNGMQVAYNACNRWVVENADGMGGAQPIDQLLYRSWSGGGLSQWDLAELGQVYH